MNMKEISGFINTEGKLTSFPSKKKKKILALVWLAEQIPADREYSEKEFNDLLRTLHTFSDPATLRREMYDYYLIDRDSDGQRYRLNPEHPDAETLIDRYCGGQQMNSISLRRFTRQDIPSATAIMKAAFDEDSSLFRTVHDGPPGYDDGSFLRVNAIESGADSYCVLVDEQIAGAVIVFCNPQLRENFLGCIFLDPSLRGKGLGKQVWDKVESMYPDVKTWRTETPLCSRRNLNFYINKLGFMAYRIDDPMDYEAASVQFVKYR